MSKPTTLERIEREATARRAVLEARIRRQLEVPAGAELRLGDIGDQEIRAADSDGGPIGFTGTAAVFGKRTRIGESSWGFFEEIEEGAFADALDDDEIRLLKNHNTDLVLARKGSGNLRHTEKTKGLLVDADMTPTTYAQDLALSLDAGDVHQMSFAFTLKTDGFDWVTLDDDDPDKGKVIEPELRVIKKRGIKRLWETSPVTFPAYVDTEASLKMADLDAFARGLGLDDTELHELAAEVRAGRYDTLVLLARTAARARSDGPDVAPQDRGAEAPATEPQAPAMARSALRQAIEIRKRRRVA